MLATGGVVMEYCNYDTREVFYKGNACECEAKLSLLGE